MSESGTHQPIDLMAEPFDEACDLVRGALEDILIPDARSLIKHPMFHTESYAQRRDLDFVELKANIILAIRHLEDASFRLDKLIQAFNGDELDG